MSKNKTSNWVVKTENQRLIDPANVGYRIIRDIMAWNEIILLSLYLMI